MADLHPAIMLRSEDRHLGLWTVHVDPKTYGPIQIFPLHIMVILRRAKDGKHEAVGRIRVQVDELLEDSRDVRRSIEIPVPENLSDDEATARVDQLLRAAHDRPGCAVHFRELDGTCASIWRALNNIDGTLTSMTRQQIPSGDN